MGAEITEDIIKGYLSRIAFKSLSMPEAAAAANASRPRIAAMAMRRGSTPASTSMRPIGKEITCDGRQEGGRRDM